MEKISETIEKLYFLRLFSLFVSIGILIVFYLQSRGMLELGVSRLNTSWVAYMLMLYVGIIVIDFISNFKSSSLSIVYPLFTAFIVVFGFGNILGLNLETSLFNRFEHIIGTLLGSIVIFSLLKTMNSFNTLKSEGMRLLFVVGLINIFLVLNEIFELFLETSTGEIIIGPSKLDTSLDLAMNFLGLGIFVIIYYLKVLRKR